MIAAMTFKRPSQCGQCSISISNTPFEQPPGQGLAHFAAPGRNRVSDLRHGVLNHALGALEPPRPVAVAIARRFAAFVVAALKDARSLPLPALLDDQANRLSHQLALVEFTAKKPFKRFARCFTRGYSCHRMLLYKVVRFERLHTSKPKDASHSNFQQV